MSISLKVELSKVAVARLLAFPDGKTSDWCLAKGLPNWAVNCIPVMQGYDYQYELTDLGKQAREQLQQHALKGNGDL